MTESTVILNAGSGGQRIAAVLAPNGVKTLAVTTTSSDTLNVARGEVSGQETFSKYGRNLDTGTASDPEDVWNGGGLYTGFPTGAAETMEIFSDSALDAAGGTGARTVQIINLLDVNGVRQPDITVTLNGLTPVSLGAGLYNRCSRMKVLTAGATGANQGGLILRHTTTTANVFAVMPALVNQTAICAYTVPAGYTLYMNSVEMQLARASGAAGSANVSLRARPLGEVFQAKISPTITNSSAFTGNTVYRVFEERTDIVARVDSVSDNGTIVTANLGGVLLLN